MKHKKLIIISVLVILLTPFLIAFSPFLIFFCLLFLPMLIVIALIVLIIKLCSKSKQKYVFVDVVMKDKGGKGDDKS